MRKLKRIVIANFYPVWPPMGGGQRRIFFLARELSKSFDVELVTLERGGSYEALEFKPTLREVRVAADPAFRNLETRLDNKVKAASDLAYTLYWRQCETYQNTLAKRLACADVAVTAHPYSIYAIQAALPDRSIPIVFDSQNIEIEQKQEVLADFPDWLQAIREIEATALRESDLTIACSTLDADNFERLYGVDRSLIKVIENGVDAFGVPHVPQHYIDDIRQRLGIGNSLVTIFGGSFHFPNFHAVDAILNLAGLLPQVIFLILGSVCEYDSLKSTSPPNVVRLGSVPESTKWLAYSLAEIGLNPVTQGSGTNVKMFEYAAAGLTILTTPFGARGLPLNPHTEYVMSEVESWPDVLRKYADSPLSLRRALGEKARDKIEAVADWTVIGDRYKECFSQVLDRRERHGGGQDLNPAFEGDGDHRNPRLEFNPSSLPLG